MSNQKNDYYWSFLIFISIFIFIISIGIPNLLLNDTVLTVEQLHQLSSGNQILFSEGKYGLMENGTQYNYFKARNGILMYSLLLPVCSLPALSIITLFGEFYDYFIIYLWAFLSILFIIFLGCITKNMLDVSKRYKKIIPAIFLSLFIFFFINLYLYQPLSHSSPSYFEIPAVILTNHILLALMGIFIFKIFKNLHYSNYYSCIFTICIYFCSSYLFWSTDAKDHILVTFLLGIFLYSISSHYVKKEIHYFYLSILLTGIIFWARPEIGVGTLISLIGYSIYYEFIYQKCSKSDLIKFFLIFSILLLASLIPFFINNYIATQNPLTPAFILATDITDYNIDNLNLDEKSPFDQNIVIYFFNLLHINYLLPILLLKVFLNPDSGSMGFLTVNPLPIIGIFMLLFYRYSSTKYNIQEQNKVFAFFSGFLALCIVGIYMIISNDGLNMSHGIAPDVRYLSPAYLPLSLFSLLIIHPFIPKEITGKTILNTLKIWIVWGFVLAAILLFSLPKRNIYFDNDILSIISIGLCCLIMCAVVLIDKKNIPKTLFLVLIGMLIIVPFMWQMNELLYYAFRRPWGYDFWLPLSSYIYSNFFLPLYR
jgi:hypothetical protein